VSELSDKHEDSTVEELMEAIGASTDKKQKAELMTITRNKISAEERALRKELKDAAEDSKEEKRALKKTHTVLLDTRKEYLHVYREMNAIMNSKSMLKHLGDFSTKVEAFKKITVKYNAALDSHLENLAAVKRQNQIG